jgi:hypothetical protein
MTGNFNDMEARALQEANPELSLDIVTFQFQEQSNVTRNIFPIKSHRRAVRCYVS